MVLLSHSAIYKTPDTERMGEVGGEKGKGGEGWKEEGGRRKGGRKEMRGRRGEGRVSQGEGLLHGAPPYSTHTEEGLVSFPGSWEPYGNETNTLLKRDAMCVCAQEIACKPLTHTTIERNRLNHVLI